MRYRAGEQLLLHSTPSRNPLLRRHRKRFSSRFGYGTDSTQRHRTRCRLRVVEGMVWHHDAAACIALRHSSLLENLPLRSSDTQLERNPTTPSSASSALSPSSPATFRDVPLTPFNRQPTASGADARMFTLDTIATPRRRRFPQPHNTLPLLISSSPPPTRSPQTAFLYQIHCAPPISPLPARLTSTDAQRTRRAPSPPIRVTPPSSSVGQEQTR
ncbi:hypothetical protein R3P38DRAFT_3008136 [Favolaschia claudopus]|uniref:Uncharacterized protein n=1 Tax=Favolaschia claudopus TaxID=2862362 RepID=A0AAW0AKH5_9AGAR